jgi:16S rRNA (cytosine967-C5)-methyltransferase
MNKQSERVLACRILASLAQHHGSLASLLTAETLDQAHSPALLQELCYGVCRWYPRLQFYLQLLLEKPLRKKDLDVHCLLLVGLYQLLFMRTPDHACINECVATADVLGKQWARGLINAVLREAQRQQAELPARAERDYSAWYAHPDWLLNRLKQDWPAQYRDILDGNNQRAPMTLRVNQCKATRAQCLDLLVSNGVAANPGNSAPYSLYLTQPMDTSVLPGFAEGMVSVQDESSQLVATVLPIAPGLRVLDACAAPGGKTCALLEAEPSLQILALDNEARRLPRIQQNLDRLSLHAEVQCADITQNDAARFGQFERILLDVPCSATGVIRRHPDIKLLRTPAEVDILVGKQHALLRAAWPLLKPGGYLLYSTCSLLKAENTGQIAHFLGAHPDATCMPLQIADAIACDYGMQLLPKAGGTDGFYYALLRKQPQAV